LRACDNLEPRDGRSPTLVMKKFEDDSASTSSNGALTAKPSDYGAFAPLVLEGAGAGDSIACRSSRPPPRRSARCTTRRGRSAAARVALVGGLSESIRSFSAGRTRRRAAASAVRCADGAILLAGGVLPASAPGSARA